MRLGTNPEKHESLIEIESYHRVVIPVYIPNLADSYFKDGLRIFKLCVESLLLTIHDKTRISIINNGCCNEVNSYLDDLYKKNECVDQLLYSKKNLGKVNAIYSAVKSNLEPLITIADADVMFLPHWQKEVENVFVNFPQAGMVSPVPSIGSLKGSFLRSTIGFAFFNRTPKYEKVKNINGINKFLKSIGKDTIEDKEKAKYYTVQGSNLKAVLGCGHFMATIRSEVFKYAPSAICEHKIVGGSENKYIDEPNDKGGFLKLSTLDNFGFHLGNTYQSWMNTELSNIKKISFCEETTIIPKVKPRKIYFYLGYLIQKLFIR